MLEMWHLGTWSLGMVGWVGIGFGGLGGLFQPSLFYDCVIPALALMPASPWYSQGPAHGGHHALSPSRAPSPSTQLSPRQRASFHSSSR